MSVFDQKRKARTIRASVDDDDDDSAPGVLSGPASEEPRVMFVQKSSKKSFRSSVRESLDPDNDSPGNAKPRTGVSAEDEEEDGPAVIRGGMSKSALRRKKKTPASRLADPPELPAQKKASLGLRVSEDNAPKKGVPLRALPARSLDDHNAQPTYSKEYLAELRSSTPNAPQNLSSLHPDEDDALVFDTSELDGALVMNDADFASAPATAPKTTILTDAEIQERKERRARLARERPAGEGDDYIPLNDDDGDDERRRKRKTETRLVAEDEDLGEGFDDFVEDGGIALGRKASREARRRARKEMAEMIMRAEGNSDDSSSESEAERRAAYEAAQARAGMDGLKRPKGRGASSAPSSSSAAAAAGQVPPKITPLPDLDTCVARLRERAAAMGREVWSGAAKVAELEREREEVLSRQAEVQRLLDEAGERYRAAAAGRADVSSGSVRVAAANGATPAEAFAGERGLESFGTPGGRDEDGDEEMG